MTWLFELSAACVVVALALPTLAKLLPPRLAPARVRVRSVPPPADRGPSA